ncbi:helix-turn-helix domain-containing protein [Granulicella paludicola]|uniref:helix-turn-helix domain-containing protein n=1 Tax=Granulicella paludicola TaxID=474951 RepID=UPI0021E0DCFA|nr:helix-turn-helix transcriptional regulator [Granulicella paludicola]
MATLRKQFGKKLRSIRKRHGLTQEKFAELLDISVDFLSLVERGLNAPSFETIESFSITLGIPVREFFDFASETLDKS